MVWDKVRAYLVPVAGALLLVASFLPWFAFDLPVAAPYSFSGTKTAWQASWMWCVALLVAFAATGVWLLFRQDYGGVPRAARNALLAIMLGALGLTVWQAVHVVPVDSRVLVVAAVGVSDDAPRWYPPEFALRDRPMDVELEGGLGWGFPVGLAAMALLALAMVTTAGGPEPDRPR
jgi:hypothetical protein